MTSFTGPLNVKPLFSEATSATIDASGSATFLGSLTVAGPIAASATATFNGPIRVGGGAGNGYAFLAVSATVHAVNSAGNPVTFTLPAGSDIIEIYADTVVPWAAGSLSTAANIVIGVSASVEMLAVIPASASGTRRLGSAFATATIKRWQRFTQNVGNGDASGVVQAFVTAQSLDTAMTVGETFLTISYVQRT